MFNHHHCKNFSLLLIRAQIGTHYSRCIFTGPEKRGITTFPRTLPTLLLIQLSMCAALIPRAGISKIHIHKGMFRLVDSSLVLTTVGRAYPGAGLCVPLCSILWSSFWPISPVCLGPWVTSSVSATPPSLVSPRDSLRACYLPLSRLLMSSISVNPCWLFTVAVFSFHLHWNDLHKDLLLNFFKNWGKNDYLLVAWTLFVTCFKKYLFLLLQTPRGSPPQGHLFSMKAFGQRNHISWK